jgi:formate hydrogenlyase subunit 3/multisubunit Na+/H+ antiporter MnhD subunit
MGTLWSHAFWKAPLRAPQTTRPVPPAMLMAMALLGACTVGLGIAIEPASRFARAAAVQMTPAVIARQGAGTEGTP